MRERRCFQCEFMVQGGVCPGRSERFFRDKQSRRLGRNEEVGEKRGRGRTERNAGGVGKETFRKRNPEQISRPAPD